MATAEIITPVTIKIDRDSVNLVQVRWLNEYGGTSQHTFKLNRYIKNENKNVKTILTNDFSKKSNVKVLGNSLEGSIKIGADNITADYWRQLSKVTFAQVKDSSGEWINKVINHSNDEVTIREGTYNIEMTVMDEPYKLQEF